MKVIRAICHVFTWICMIMIFAMMLLMVADVIARSVFNHPITGATEIVQIMLVCNMSAMGAAVLSGRMVEVNMLTSALKHKTQVILDIVVLLFTLAIVVLLCIQQFKYGVSQLTKHVVWTSIKVPQWPFVMLFGLSYGVGGITIIATIIRKIMSAVHGEYEKEVKLGTLDPEFAFGKANVEQASKEAKAREDELAEIEAREKQLREERKTAKQAKKGEQ